MAPFVFDVTDPMVIVFRLPKELPSDFCFGGGFPVQFQMVDWFQCPAFHLDTKKPITATELRNAIIGKRYAKPGERFLVIARAGDAMIVGKGMDYDCPWIYP